MEFTKRLRSGVERGDITCSIRIWMQPRVTPGKHYKMGGGEIVVDSVQQISLDDITPTLARESGFASVVDLLKIAKHGRGSNVYLVRFHYVAGRAARAAPVKRANAPVRAAQQRKRVIDLLERLPEARAIAHASHLSLEVRKKRFGYFLVDHHGDSRVALNCKSSPDLRDSLRERVPDSFHIPKYLGNKGWIGLWLDVPEVDWSAVALALREAYALVAPKSLTTLDRTRTKKSPATRARA